MSGAARGQAAKLRDIGSNPAPATKEKTLENPVFMGISRVFLMPFLKVILWAKRLILASFC
jgi:hypothetical protein